MPHSASKKTIREIMKGKASITGETVFRLEKLLGVPVSFRTNRARLYPEGGELRVNRLGRGA